MKITVTTEAGDVVYNDVTDAFVAVRQLKPAVGTKGDLVRIYETQSHSWGAEVRELVKELQQSVVELQDYLREQRNGGTG